MSPSRESQVASRKQEQMQSDFWLTTYDSRLATETDN